MAIEIIKGSIENEKPFELGMGDIVETYEKSYLVVCDGYGNFQFIEIDGLYTLVDSKGKIVTVDGGKKYEIGGLLADINTYRNLAIKEVHKEKDIKITIKY